jgi:hypothetical protein
LEKSIAKIQKKQLDVKAVDNIGANGRLAKERVRVVADRTVKEKGMPHGL